MVVVATCTVYKYPTRHGVPNKQHPGLADFGRKASTLLPIRAATGKDVWRGVSRLTFEQQRRRFGFRDEGTERLGRGFRGFRQKGCVLSFLEHRCVCFDACAISGSCVGAIRALASVFGGSAVGTCVRRGRNEFWPESRRRLMQVQLRNHA